MSAPLRVVVFTGGPGYSVTKGIITVDDARPGLQWLVIHHAPNKTLRQLLRNQWRNLKRNGWRWLTYQLVELWKLLVQRLRPPVVRGPGGIRDFGLAALESKTNVRVERVADLHGEATLELVRAFAPDLGLSLAAPILRRQLFLIPRLGTINLHKGKLPDFRGMPPAFWELWHEQSSVGCSVHQVDDKLDTGCVLVADVVQRQPFSTLKSLQLQLDEVGHRLLSQAVSQVLDGTARAIEQQPGTGRTFRKPTLAQQGELRRKLRSPVRPALVAKAWLKDLAFGAGSAIHGALVAPLIEPRVTVLLYHRVSDEVRDNLTVGVEQFDRQMAMLARDCEVLGIEQVLAMQRVPRSRRPLVAVTFDDGYLDNYSQAVPILLRHKLPAAFFVSTGIVGTDGRFPHDVRRGNPPIAVMQWEQLRHMRELGLTVGSHAVKHIDCAAEPEPLVRDELVRSRADLQRELGLDQVIFAYPYGGRQHMTPSRLELVRQAGYVGCLSAYGGSNVGRVDPFNVLRKGINHEFSEPAFRWECLGLR